MKINIFHYLYGGAVLTLGVGIILTAASARQAASLEQSLWSRAAVVAKLQAMKLTQNRYTAAVRTFETLSNAVPVSLSGLAAASVTNTIPDIRELETRPLERGWTLTRAEVIFNDLHLDQLPAFLRVAESRRPPWRLTECSLTASTRADGYGRVVLIMEAIGKPAK